MIITKYTEISEKIPKHKKHTITLTYIAYTLKTIKNNIWYFINITPRISYANNFTSEPTDKVDGIIHRRKLWYWNGS